MKTRDFPWWTVNSPPPFFPGFDCTGGTENTGIAGFQALQADRAAARAGRTAGGARRAAGGTDLGEEGSREAAGEAGRPGGGWGMGMGVRGFRG